MASRILRGARPSRPSRPDDGNNERGGKAAPTPKSPSVASNVSSSSRIPRSTSSFFSRSKIPRVEEFPPVPGRSNTAANMTESSKAAAAPVAAVLASEGGKPRGSHAMGLGIHTEVVSPAKALDYGPRQSSRLRRKASAKDNHSRYAESESTNFESTTSSQTPKFQPDGFETTSSPGGYIDPFPGSILGMSLPTIAASTTQVPSLKPKMLEHATSSSRMAHHVSSSLTHGTPPNDTNPPTTSYVARSSAASTRYSVSPGAFSRTSTPTSVSSHSPGVISPSKFTSRLNLTVESRPPITKHRGIENTSLGNDTEPSGLPVLRESVTSSSSGSTIRATEPTVHTDAAALVKKVRPSATPPTPPLRTSSKRLPKSRNFSRIDRPEATLKAVPQSQLPAPITSIKDTPKSDSKTPLHSTNLGKTPPRPSRDGAPSLDHQNKPPPVVQSNLRRLETTGHKRRESVEKAVVSSPSSFIPTPTVRPSLVRTFSSASKIPTVSSSPRVGKPNHIPSAPLRIGVSRVIPRLQTNFPVKPLEKEPTISSSTSAKSPKKFSLFSKPSKPSLEPGSVTIPDKNTKKGPAAGTGHEGYGKYGRRGRSGSISSSASRGRSTSIGSKSSRAGRPPSSRKTSFGSQLEPELDDFYRDRLDPVVIRGSGATSEHHNSPIYRTTSAESGASSTSSLGLSTSAKRTEHATYAYNDVKEGKEATHIPTLAARRLVHPSKPSEYLRIPPTIDTQVLVFSPSLDSHDTLQSSIPTTDSTTSLNEISEGHEGNWFKSRKPLDRIKLPSKWNFFQRAQQSPRRTNAIDCATDIHRPEQLSASISKNPEPRIVAHYALLDGSEKDASEALDDLLLDIEEDLELRHQDSLETYRVMEQDDFNQEQDHSILLPSPPTSNADFPGHMRPSPPKVALHHREARAELKSSLSANAPKQSRLPQIGRIPKVDSKVDRPHKPPQQSFSRPFFRRPELAVEPAAEFAMEPAVISDTSEETRKVHVSIEQVVPNADVEDPLSTVLEDYSMEQAMNVPIAFNPFVNCIDKDPFLSFSPRKGSEVSGSSSSGIASFVGITAIQPTYQSAPSEDEIWNEYDELLDRVVCPFAFPAISHGRDNLWTLASETSHNDQVTSWDGLKKESPVLRSSESSRSTVLPAHSPRSSPLQVATTPPVSALPTPPRSSTTSSFSDFFAGYGDRSSLGAAVRPKTLSTGSQYSSSSIPSTSGSRTSHGSNRDEKYRQLLARTGSNALGAQNGLRFSAVMTSRWLSFNRVLFSPAQDEIENNKQDRILVLDGLCNDDWSTYCAMIYPDAVVYNLGTLQAMSARKRGSITSRTLSNHRRIHHASFTHPFPFPKGFFTVVVLRFPVASSESAFYHAISECKRVLRPGGYLELSVLDMDMVNMGNRARRAVRSIKTRTQAAEPDISLSPASDNIQKMLGRRGFENLNRCMVGVPVAGSISDSQASSLDEKDLSLTDMLRNDSMQGEVPITKMAAKVGRWWWSRCYEAGITGESGDQGPSIWDDKALLKECEKRETGFKLLICYAQKPLNPRRRTVSV